MKKFMTFIGAASLAFIMVITPISAQDTNAGSNGYRGIIPTSTTSTNGNAGIDCNITNQGVEVMNPDIANDIGAKIHCGYVSLNDFPLLVIYLIQWVLTIAGGIAVIMIMIGGFQYMLGGVTDDKERGKKTLIYAITGLVVAFMAWWIVELIQVWLTS